MPPRLPLKPREIISRLKRLGFVRDHTTGSHEVYYHVSSKRRAAVPIHTKELPKGTVKAIVREAGIDLDDFLKGKG